MFPPDGIQHTPPPWKLKGTIYVFCFWSKLNEDGSLPTVAYSPLEYASSFSTPDGGRPLGGLGMIQLIRYTESPVGPYDELIVCAGAHEYTVEEDGKRVTKKNLRITRIYVSQKYTCWNGRHNWNIAKHLAKFDWTHGESGQVTVKVFPHDTTDDPTEANPSSVPLFQTSFKTIPYVPSFPLDFTISKYVGLDLLLVHPPLPAGKGSQGETPGTERWASVYPGERSPKTSIGWFDIRQDAPDGDSGTSYEENFWPGLGRWHLGVIMENAEIDFPEGEYWDGPKTIL